MSGDGFDSLSEYQREVMREAIHASHVIGDPEINSETGRQWLRGLLQKAFVAGVKFENLKSVELAKKELAKREAANVT